MVWGPYCPLTLGVAMSQTVTWLLGLIGLLILTFLCVSLHASDIEAEMTRRVEAAFPIEAAHLKRRVIREGFEVYLLDNQQAWELNADATYTRVERAPGEPARSAQGMLLAELTEGA